MPQVEENGTEKVISQSNQQMVSQILANASEPTFHLRHALGYYGSTSDRKTHKCCVYIAGSSKYCARLNSIQAYNDINRDVSLLLLRPLHAIIALHFFFFGIVLVAFALFFFII